MTAGPTDVKEASSFHTNHKHPHGLQWSCLPQAACHPPADHSMAVTDLPHLACGYSATGVHLTHNTFSYVEYYDETILNTFWCSGANDQKKDGQGKQS